MSHTIELDDRDAEIVCSALRAAYVQVLDAIGMSAGAPYSYTRPRSEPRDITSHLNTLDRIERFSDILGHPLHSRRRQRTEDYYAEQVAIWDAEQMLVGGGA